MIAPEAAPASSAEAGHSNAISGAVGSSTSASSASSSVTVRAARDSAEMLRSRSPRREPESQSPQDHP
eukprot:10361495-Karenia_brevis.AAC.1